MAQATITVEGHRFRRRREEKGGSWLYPIYAVLNALREAGILQGSVLKWDRSGLPSGNYAVRSEQGHLVSLRLEGFAVSMETNRPLCGGYDCWCLIAAFVQFAKSQNIAEEGLADGWID